MFKLLRLPKGFDFHPFVASQVHVNFGFLDDAFGQCLSLEIDSSGRRQGLETVHDDLPGSAGRFQKPDAEALHSPLPTVVPRPIGRLVSAGNAS